MEWDYQRACNYLQSREALGISLGIKRIERLTELLNHPQKNQKIIHVAGTNGKGSVCLCLKAILEKAGFKVGVFLSPYIKRVNEMLVIKEEITDIAFSKIIYEIKNIIDNEEFLKDNITSFEILTASALVYFKEESCDFTILETGLGGIDDATNIINPLITLFTQISYDHLNFLGEDIKEIARKKAGIIKKGSKTVLGIQKYDEAKEIIKEVAKRKNNELIIASKADWQINSLTNFNYRNLHNIENSLAGYHQMENAIIAIEAAFLLRGLGYHLCDQDIKEGIKNLKHRGRLEKLSDKPLIYLDGAHNVEGILAVTNYLKEISPKNKFKFIFGVLKDKEYLKMLNIIIPLIDKIYFAMPDNSRALESSTLEKILMEKRIEATSFSNVTSCLKKCLEESKEEDIICILGSLYMLKDVYEFFGGNGI